MADTENSREMSLEEWVNKLPAFHLANIEYKFLRQRTDTLFAELAKTKKDLKEAMATLDWIAGVALPPGNELEAKFCALQSEAEKAVARITEFPALKAYRDVAEGRITKEEYAAVDPSPRVVQPSPKTGKVDREDVQRAVKKVRSAKPPRDQ